MHRRLRNTTPIPQVRSATAHPESASKESSIRRAFPQQRMHRRAPPVHRMWSTQRTKSGSSLLRHQNPPRPRIGCCTRPEVRARGISSRASWLPCSTIRPSSITTIRFASRIVERRCAMTKLVRSLRRTAVALLDQQFGARVHRTGRLVEDQDGRLRDEGAGDGDELLLGPH